MKIPFTKMHGLGNDMILVNGITNVLPNDLPAFAKHICDRRLGVGADQLLIAYGSDKADYRLDIFNADGSPAEMCGNGIRCFAKYLRDKGLSQKTELAIETLAGIIKPEIVLDHPKTNENTLWVRVDMGEPQSAHPKAPRELDHFSPWQIQIPIKVTEPPSNWLPSDPREFRINEISMGNPHCVIFVNAIDSYPVERVGSYFENHPRFPNRTNVEFVQVIERNHIRQRTWERGAGETLACGTGACAAVVACVLNDSTDKNVIVSLKGGDLEIKWSQRTGHVIMTGPAVTVTEGEVQIEQ